MFPVIDRRDVFVVSGLFRYRESLHYNVSPAMRMLPRIVLGACLAPLLIWSSLACGSDADGDLRHAAKLQKNGETATALAIWKRWAEKGNADAAYNLAVIHQHGDGVAVDYAQALHWYRHAAALGDRISEYQIGLMYQIGQGVAADAAEAHRWFTAHRSHHAHHERSEQMQTWRKQAARLIEESDRREALAKSRADSARVLAELRRRAGASAAPTDVAAAATDRPIN